jgi:5-methylcytosine-specific restriction endonuclease McrA
MADDSQPQIDTELKIISLRDAEERGLSRYFTGVPCKRGHISERSVKWRACLECQSMKHKDWLKAHPASVKRYRHKAYHKDIGASRAALKERRKSDPEKFRQYKRDDYQKHRPKRLATVRAYYRTNTEKAQASGVAWRKKHPEKSRAIARKWASANYDKILEWQQKNPEKVRVYARNAQARRRAALYACEGSFSKSDIDRIKKLQRGLCAYCRCKLNSKYHVDHITPLAKGGSNWPSNLQLCCPPCNLTKQAMDPIEYAQSIGRLI